MTLLGATMQKHVMVLSCVAAITAGTFVNPSLAQENTDNINPWLHCGIGALIFQNNGTLAAISNIIWDLGTTAVTSKLSSPESCSGNRTGTALFIQQTYPQLAVETAVGNGQHLVAVAELLGCEQSVHASFIRQVRVSMTSDVAQSGYAALSHTEKAEKFFHIVDGLARSEFSAQCRAT